MSDAFTDCAMDELREKRYRLYLNTLYAYLNKETSRGVLLERARGVDVIPRGYWCSRTSFGGEENMRRLRKLRRGSKKAWREFLESLGFIDRIHFKKISPLASEDR